MKRWLLILGISLTAVGLIGMLAVPLLTGAFSGTSAGDLSLGERIYLTGIGEDGPIPRNGLFAHHHLNSAGCAGCHGTDGRGGTVFGGTGATVEAPEITYRALTETHSEEGTTQPGWSREQIEKAIRTGVEPNGERLNRIMPRWDTSDAEMDALIGYLKELDD